MARDLRVCFFLILILEFQCEKNEIKNELGFLLHLLLSRYCDMFVSCIVFCYICYIVMFSIDCE